MKRIALLVTAVIALAGFSVSGQVGRGAATRREDGGVYGQPHKDPRTISAADVDTLMWPIVSRINQSGWLWTTESCQGHDDPASSPDGLPRRPALLGLVTDDPTRLFGILAEINASLFSGERLARLGAPARRVQADLLGARRSRSAGTGRIWRGR
jgi:hypothetical protein